MTQPAKHTPTPKFLPVSLHGACMRAADGAIVADLDMYKYRESGNYIVKAVNSHAKLLEALKYCLLEHGGYTISGECEKNARAAIAEAEAEGGA